MSREIDTRILARFLGEMHRKIDGLADLGFEQVVWTTRGPGHAGVFMSREANGQVDHSHVYGQDHSLRIATYAEAAKEYEGRLPAFLRTYIFSDPPFFVVASEDGPHGELVEKKWAAEMLGQGLPEVFVKRITPTVQE